VGIEFRDGKERIYQVIGKGNYPKVLWAEMGKGRLVSIQAKERITLMAWMFRL